MGEMTAAAHPTDGLNTPAFRSDSDAKTGWPILRRVQTALRSFWVLKGLTPEQIDSFMNSYVI